MCYITLFVLLSTNVFCAFWRFYKKYGRYLTYGFADIIPDRTANATATAATIYTASFAAAAAIQTTRLAAAAVLQASFLGLAVGEVFHLLTQWIYQILKLVFFFSLQLSWKFSFYQSIFPYSYLFQSTAIPVSTRTLGITNNHPCSILL